jgi:hypothetical protein
METISKNKYVQVGSKYILGLSGLALTAMTFRILKRSFTNGHSEVGKEIYESMCQKTTLQIF